MDQVQKTALKETAKTVTGLTALAILVPAMIYLVPLDVLVSLALAVMLVMGVKMIYEIKLNEAKVKQIEIDAEIDRLHK